MGGTDRAPAAGMPDSNAPASRERRGAPRGSALDPLYALLRWIDHHVRGFHAAVGVYLAVGIVLILVGVLLFAGTAELMHAGTTQRFDDAVLLWLNARASPRLDALAVEVTALGSTLVILMTLLVSSIFLWGTEHRYSAALLWVAAAGGGILNTILKAAFDRPRPHLFPWRVPYAGHSSFPSGHSMTAMVVYATLAYLVVRIVPTRGLRRFTLAVFAAVILAVGLSRMYLGVHYPSDVLGGYLIGFAWASFCALGVEAVRYFRDKPGMKGHEEGIEEGAQPILDAVTPHPQPPS